MDGNEIPDDSFAGRHVLITGGTGSLGTALIRRLLSRRHGVPSAITIFSRDEFKQFHLRAVLDREYGSVACRLRFRIGDIRDLAAVQQAMRPADVVFHAAALKQVPQCEYNPVEAVQTNVMGLANLVRAAGMNGSPVEAFIAALDRQGLPSDQCHGHDQGAAGTDPDRRRPRCAGNALHVRAIRQCPRLARLGRRHFPRRKSATEAR